MKKSLFIILGLLVFNGLSACNTWRGLGKDVQTVGKAIEDTGKK
jgi:entericidin B